MKSKSNLWGVILASMFLALDVGAQGTSFYIASSPQSEVGIGETYSVTPSDGFTILAYPQFNNTIAVTIEGQGANSPWWFLYFAAPGNVPLTPGTYLGAEHWPFQSPAAPGLSFSGNGRNTSTLTGSFTVLEVQYGAGGTIDSFAADFVQYDQGNLDAWNQGSIRFNSTVPEPRTLTLLGCFTILLVLSRERLKRSHRLAQQTGCTERRDRTSVDNRTPSARHR